MTDQDQLEIEIRGKEIRATAQGRLTVFCLTLIALAFLLTPLLGA